MNAQIGYTAISMLDTLVPAVLGVSGGLFGVAALLAAVRTAVRSV